MTREEIIQWYEDELARLRQAPHLNGCDMTPEWAKQIEVHTAAVAAMRERETVTNRNGLTGWISVEDRLPPEGERVLTTDGAFVGEMYINKRGKWQRYNVNDSALLMALDILWWMPLPEPPKEDT